MRLPRSNRTSWIVAGVLAVVAAAVAAYAVHQLGKPANRVNTNVAFSPTTSTAPPAAGKAFLWPFYGGQQARTRDFTGSPSLHPPFRLAWRLGGNALLEFPVSIWGNNLYYMDDGATVKRVNATSGKLLWERHMGTCHGCGLSASTPALDVAHKLMFVSVLSLTGSQIGAVGGELAAVSMINGRTVWRYPVPSGSESSPMVVGNSVYFGDQSGTLTSLNVLTGKVNWTFPTGGAIKAGPAYAGGNLYFGNYAGSFYAVNASTGKQVWSMSPGGQFYSTPAVAYGRVYVGNNNGAAYSFDAATGALAWSRTLGGYVYSGPAVADVPGLGYTVYIGSYDGYLYALNARTGATDWASYAPGARPGISGSATVINNVVYVSTVYQKGSYGFNATTGKRVFYFPDGSYTTVVADRNAIFLMGEYVIYKLVPKS